MEDGLKGNKTGNMCLKSNSSCGGSFRSCKCIYELWEKKISISFCCFFAFAMFNIKNLRMYTILAILQKNRENYFVPYCSSHPLSKYLQQLPHSP